MHSPGFRLVDLRFLRGSDLGSVLDAQVLHWRERYCWDYEPNTALIRGLLDEGELKGFAAVADDRPTGYCCYVPRGTGAAVSDLFVEGSRAEKGLRARCLLEATLNAAMLRLGATRIEGQLPWMGSLPHLQFALPGVLRTFPRELMLTKDLGLANGGALLPPGARILPWSDILLDRAADLVVLAYKGHVDREVSTLFASAAGARSLLVRAPAVWRGKGGAPPGTGLVALVQGQSGLAGLSLGRQVARGVGHVLQLCVAPRARRIGLGRLLLQRTLKAFGRAGYGKATLTVTSANTPAVRLYRRYGFRRLRSFQAFVWHRQ